MNNSKKLLLRNTLIAGVINVETSNKIKEQIFVECHLDKSKHMKEAYQAYLDHYDSKADLSTVQDRYQGHYNCPEDFAEQLYNEIYNIPEFLENFIDWSAVWRNLDTGGDYFEADGHIFSCY